MGVFTKCGYYKANSDISADSEWQNVEKNMQTYSAGQPSPRSSSTSRASLQISNARGGFITPLHMQPDAAAGFQLARLPQRQRAGEAERTASSSQVIGQ